MASKPYIHHNKLKEWREKSRRIDHLHPITYARVDLKSDDDFKGYLASQDGRIILRFVDDLEADAKFGVRGATTDECIGLIYRLGNLKEIEDAALDAQRDVVLLRRALLDITTNPDSGQIAKAKARKALDDTARE
jgi:hypothetical protein